MSKNPFAVIAAPHSFTVRDGVAVSDQAAVLTAPDHDRSLNLAIWTSGLALPLQRFFSASAWQTDSYQLFKPLLGQTGNQAVAQGATAKLPFNERGFFPVTVGEEGTPRVVDGKRLYAVNHSGGDTHFLLMGDFWDKFVQQSATPAHPLLQHVTARREAVKTIFGVAKVDVELRFETARFGAPVGYWHPDADRGRLISTLTGNETEFLRERYVRRDMLRTVNALQAKNANSKSIQTKLAVVMRELLGPRFDYTRLLVTEPGRVEAMPRGHLARMIGGQSVKEGKADCSLVHRRPRAWLKDRVVEMYYPHLK